MARLSTLVGVVALLAGLATGAAADSMLNPPPRGVAVSNDGKAMLAGEVCSDIVAHVPDSDVTYKSGKDVYGRRVEPADVGGSHSSLAGDDVPIELTVEIRQRFRIGQEARLLKPERQVGTISVQGDRVLFNGMEITANETKLLSAACRAHGY